MKSKYDNTKTPEEKQAFWISADGLRRCGACLEYKPEDCYHNDAGGYKGKTYICKECANSRAKAHHKRRMLSDPSYKSAKKESYIKQAHGITTAQYAELLAQQAGCAICGTTAPKGGWHLDHNHTTGKRREFLCNPCNRGIGYLQDSEQLLLNAASYLRKHNE